MASTPPDGRRRSLWLVLTLVAVGALVRLALLRLPRLWYDEATTGIMGLSVLRGEWPIYFYGQPYMGALDAYLAAPLYVTLGVSARTLELLPVLLALVWLALVVRLAWEAFGPRSALFTALLLAVPPNFLLRWSHEARPHYPLTMIFGTLALLLALRIPTQPSGRAALHFGLLGGVLGLAFWTNFLSLVFWPTIAALLLMRGLRLSSIPAALTAVPTFALGSLPHWLYGLQRATALPPPGRRIALSELVEHLGFVRRLSWPILTGVPTDLRGTSTGTLLAVGLAMAYGAALITAARAIRRGAPAARSVGLALLLLVAVNVGVAVGTAYGERLNDHDQKYLLPVYTALPVLLGHWLARLGASRAAGLLAGALLLVQGAGAARGAFRNLAPSVAAAERAELQHQLDTVAALEEQGLHRLYGPDSGTRILTFISAERVIFSDHYQEIYPPYARAVDGAEAVGWWFGRRHRAFEANLTALGVSFAYRRAGPAGGAYVDFSVPPQAVRELEPADLTITASDDLEGVARMVDRDAATLWRATQPMRGGEWIQVDLGATVPVALVRWLPGTFQEAPRGLRLEASRDGKTWHRLVELPAYMGPLYWSAGRPMARVRAGRVELRMPPTPARFLRITQTGQDAAWHWTVRELFAYAAAVGQPEPGCLRRRVRRGGVPAGTASNSPCRSRRFTRLVGWVAPRLCSHRS